MDILMTLAVYSSPLSFTIIKRERQRRWKKEMVKIKRVKRWREMIIWEAEKEKDTKSEERLTMCFLAKGTVNCCSLHQWPFGEWIEIVSGWMVYCEMLASVVWSESCFDHLTRSDQVCIIEESNPLIVNDSLLIGFLQTPLYPTNSKQSLDRSVCVSLGRCLVSLASWFRLIFSFLCLSLSFILELCWNCECSFVWRASQFLHTHYLFLWYLKV